MSHDQQAIRFGVDLDHDMESVIFNGTFATPGYGHF